MSETSAPNENVEECLLAPTNGRLVNKKKDEKDISCRQYYAFKLQIRYRGFLLKTGRLFQQFIVDMYVKIENTRLDHFRDHQKAIRADMYQGLTDSMGMGEHDASNVGRCVILPASFIGGPRDMHKRYLNAMAIVQKYGKPDLFVTMTCNPNWPEIKEELVAGEQVQNRPDLVALIFHAKLVELKKDIMDKKVFGPVAGMICVVEFQKRGLPHAHFLIILESQFKIKNPEDFDGYVSAEIPSTDSPHLHSAVLKHMMHGPCGNYNPNCSCMKQKDEKKVCKYGYPKKFVEATTSGSDSYPIYRRRDTQETVCVRRIQMDNRWVIPYNPYLLAKFDCHLNVEVCSTINAVKYLYKYVYKGHDRISFRLSTIDLANPNEIERYQAGRWVSPPEAAWRIFEFNLFEMHPTVLPLQLHLPNMQQVQFRENEDLADIVSDERRSRTMLTEFFNINSQRPEGPAYLYSEWPEHFVWDESTRCWKDRQRGFNIGRLVYAASAEGERYYLRLLLTHVRSPRSFAHLLTVNGESCATLQESALKRGLLEQDNSIEECMNEGVQVKLPHALRRLFATLLIFCQPADPTTLWSKYYAALSEDFRHKFPQNEDKILRLTAQQVERFLESMGKSFQDFNLHHLHALQNEEIRRPGILMMQLTLLYWQNTCMPTNNLIFVSEKLTKASCIASRKVNLVLSL